MVPGIYALMMRMVMWYKTRSICCYYLFAFFAAFVVRLEVQPAHIYVISSVNSNVNLVVWVV